MVHPRSMLLVLALLSLRCGPESPLPRPETCHPGETRRQSCLSNNEPSVGTQSCDETGHWRLYFECDCVPVCLPSGCGYNGCTGGSCGTCPSGSACDFRSGPPYVCIPATSCPTVVCEDDFPTCCGSGSSCRQDPHSERMLCP